MTKTQYIADDETLTLLNAIENLDSIFEAKITTGYGVFRLEFIPQLQEFRWSQDISEFVTKAA